MHLILPSWFHTWLTGILAYLNTHLVILLAHHAHCTFCLLTHLIHILAHSAPPMPMSLHACTPTHMHAHSHACPLTCMPTHMHAHSHSYLFTCMPTHMHSNLFTCMLPHTHGMPRCLPPTCTHPPAQLHANMCCCTH